MAQTPATDAKWQTPPAYDFRGGDLRFWQDGEVVAVFPRAWLLRLAIAILEQEHLARTNQF
jgi:hypothetical protein